MVGHQQIVPKYIKNQVHDIPSVPKRYYWDYSKSLYKWHRNRKGNLVQFFPWITLDENITWKPHIAAIANKLSKYAGILNKLKNYLPAYILRMLYCSLVNSHLSYGILLWGYECHRLEKIQKRMIRIITVSKYNAHTKPLFKALDLLKIQDMLDLSTLKFYYRYVHDNLPAYFYSFQIVTQGTYHNYDKRNRDQIHIDRTRTRYGDKRVRIYLPTVLNSTPTALLEKNCHSQSPGFRP